MWWDDDREALGKASDRGEYLDVMYKAVEGVEVGHFHKELYEKYLDCKGIPHFSIVRNPVTRFISDKTHVWKFEDGFGDDFSAWISNILGVDFSLKVNAPLSSIDKAAKSRGRVEFSDEVVDYLKKFYHNDIKQFYPELK